MGITGPLWSWFRAYLKERATMSIWILYVPVSFPLSRESLRVVSWVHFNLFLIYINHLQLSISPGCLPFLFADDTKLLRSIVSFNDHSDIQEDIILLNKWYKTWNRNLNKLECAAVRFAFSPASNTSPNYTILDTHIKINQCHHELGIIMDEKLS